MKKDRLTILSIVFLGINIVFTIAYDLYYAFGYEYGLVKGDTGISSIGTIASWVVTIACTVLLIVGVLTQKKIFFCLYYGFNIFFSLVGMGSQIIANIDHLSMNKFIPLNIFSALSNIAFNAFMLLFILIVFKWKEKTSFDTYNNNGYSSVNLNTDVLLEYKQLLDSGVITQEEFDKKKWELLNM